MVRSISIYIKLYRTKKKQNPCKSFQFENNIEKNIKYNNYIGKYSTSKYKVQNDKIVKIVFRSMIQKYVLDRPAYQTQQEWQYGFDFVRTMHGVANGMIALFMYMTQHKRTQVSTPLCVMTLLIGV